MTGGQPSPEQRFRRQHTVDGNGCWIWNGSTTGKDGRYGQFIVNGRPFKAHRWSYEDHKGTIPDGLELDHLCRVTLCVNPDHLEPVTHLVNVRRGLAARRARSRPAA